MRDRTPALSPMTAAASRTATTATRAAAPGQPGSASSVSWDRLSGLRTASSSLAVWLPPLSQLASLDRAEQVGEQDHHEHV